MMTVKFSFWFVFIDNDKKEFRIIGPTSDDRRLAAKVARLQKSGRRVLGFNSSSSEPKKSLRDSFAKRTGLKYISKKTIE